MTVLLIVLSFGEGLFPGIGDAVIPAVFAISIGFLGLSYFSAGLLFVAKLKIFGMTVLSE